MPVKRPQALSVGDEFTVPMGPYARHKVRVVDGPTPTQYGDFSVICELLSAVVITLDYATDLAVKPSGGLPVEGSE